MTTPTDPPEINALTGDAPQLGQAPAIFDANVNTLVGGLPALQTGINAVSAWMNGFKTWIGDQVAASEASAVAAATSELIAKGAANYQGDYDPATTYAVGESVTYGAADDQFVKKSDAPADTTPVDGPDWLDITGGAVPVVLEGTAPDIDLVAASEFSLELSGATVLTISNSPEVAKFTLQLTGGNYYGPFNDVVNGSYDNKWLSLTQPSATNVSDMHLSPDGMHLYKVTVGGVVSQWDFGIANDLDTLTYSGNSFSMAAQDGYLRSVAFTADGLNMYLLGTHTSQIHQYTLSTAWDLSTATYANKNISATAYGNAPYCITISPTGHKLFLLDAQYWRVREFSLSTPGDISTAVDSATSVRNVGSSARTVSLSEDGTKLYSVRDTTNDRVEVYDLPTPWSLVGATSAGYREFNDDGISYVGSFAISSNGEKFYVGSYTKVYQFTAAETLQADLAYPDSCEFPGGVALAVPVDGVTDLIDFQTIDSGVSYLVTKRGGDFS